MSPLLRFHFWEVGFFNTEDSVFPSDSPEERRWFVGISKNIGYHMTFKILNESTNKIVNRSNIRADSDKESPNLRAGPVTSPVVTTILWRVKSEDKDATSETLPNEEDPTSGT